MIKSAIPSGRDYRLLSIEIRKYLAPDIGKRLIYWQVDWGGSVAFHPWLVVALWRAWWGKQWPWAI